MHSVDKIISEFDGRIEQVQELFRDFCESTCIKDLLKGVPCWAIVGGAVRDNLIAREIAQNVETLSSIWADLDICIPVAISEVSGIRYLSRSQRFDIRQNTFGGTKIIDKELGCIDLWTWEEPGTHSCTVQDWRIRISKVDFGINSVAFLFPQLEIISDKRLYLDLNCREVERLSPRFLKRHLQPLRALAIVDKLNKNFEEQFELGVLIQSELIWLMHEADETILNASFAYLKAKLTTGRWSRNLIHHLDIASSSLGCSERFSLKLTEIKANL